MTIHKPLFSTFILGLPGIGGVKYIQSFSPMSLFPVPSDSRLIMRGKQGPGHAIKATTSGLTPSVIHASCVKPNAGQVLLTFNGLSFKFYIDSALIHKAPTSQENFRHHVPVLNRGAIVPHNWWFGEHTWQLSKSLANIILTPHDRSYVME